MPETFNNFTQEYIIIMFTIAMVYFSKWKYNFLYKITNIQELHINSASKTVQATLYTTDYRKSTNEGLVSHVIRQDGSNMTWIHL